MKGYQYLLQFLNEEGFIVKDREMFFSFKYEGGTYGVFKHNSPVVEIQFMFSGDSYGRNKILEACNNINKTDFLTKCYIQDDSDLTTTISAEFIPSDKTTNDSWVTYLSAIHRSAKNLLEILTD